MVKKNKREKRKEGKHQSLNHERNSGHPEYKNDNLILTFYYIFKNEFLGKKS